jgi:hypothetical protein
VNNVCNLLNYLKFSSRISKKYNIGAVSFENVNFALIIVAYNFGI